ncbi:MAG: hypothetical protein IKY52_00285 [Clostridia bacterium]|nr:hypothetical protein [Clostridia bacterium]
MTNIDFCDIINTVIFSILKKEGNIKISMEVNADTEEINFPHCKQHLACVNYNHMPETSVNLISATEYLIYLFIKTNRRYSCTRTKLGKLLSIVAFKYARQGRRIFDENIYKYGGCGASINELKLFVERDVYMQSADSDDGQYIQDVLDDNGLSIDNEHLKSFSSEVKNEIICVFRKFGSYSAIELGKFINPIVNYPGVTHTNGVVDLSKIESLKKDDFNDIDGHPVLLDYLFNNINGDSENVSENNKKD